MNWVYPISHAIILRTQRDTRILKWPRICFSIDWTFGHFQHTHNTIETISRATAFRLRTSIFELLFWIWKNSNFNTNFDGFLLAFCVKKYRQLFSDWHLGKNKITIFIQPIQKSIVINNESVVNSQNDTSKTNKCSIWGKYLLRQNTFRCTHWII